MTSREDYMADAIYEPLPYHMREGAKNWILHGMYSRPGSFLFAVMCNDLMQACARADDTNRRCLFDWAVWLNCYAPIECYGSITKARAWKGLLHGRSDTDASGDDAAGDDDLRGAEQGSNS